MIARQTIDEILDRASLTEIVSEGVTLKRQGTSLLGLCPFHSEKTPSFHVRDDRYYHCFGCGVSGNAISYVMRARGLAFPEAVEELASRLGIKVVYEGGRTRGKEEGAQKAALYQANLLAAAFYRAQLARDPKVAGRYLSERGLKREAIEVFQLGFASRDRSHLLQFLKGKGLSEEQVLSAALARRSPQGEVYDTFRARIMFPILMDNKHVAGFGGRIIPELVDEGVLTKAPKYLNSSDTPVYHKQTIFFGLPQALQGLRESHEAYLVEGYFDVIGLWQVGVRNVLATCGTAVSTQHVRRLKHLSRRVFLLFDGDAAGRTAAGKSYAAFLNSGLDVCAVFLPHDEDPDTFALKHGETTAAALSALPRVPLIDCYVDNLVERAGVQNASELGGAAKGRLCEELAPFLREVQNSIERNDLVQRAALRLGVKSDLLASMVEGVIARPPRMVGGEKSTDALNSNDANPGVGSTAPRQEGVVGPEVAPRVEELPRLDREILLALMAKKEELPARMLRDPDLCEAVHHSTRRFAEAVVGILGESGERLDGAKAEIKALLEDLGESWVGHWKTAHAMLGDSEVDIDKLFAHCRLALRRQRLQKQLDALSREEVLQYRSEAERLEIAKQRVELLKQIKGTGADAAQPNAPRRIS